MGAKKEGQGTSSSTGATFAQVENLERMIKSNDFLDFDHEDELRNVGSSYKKSIIM